ncbi:hypothetical protein [Aeoliella mucimassa]|uniref:Uncharacterized protein n=1 Tax=Aeoliella mucimassa TaxID=2527972 RepID=A0A518AR95_9BACT|nr:hypothetical protein [Aeoliella mucimassa]QDU57242.1 hypothetical protein Pan181_34560 [Aeoliella mucimassa]
MDPTKRSELERLFSASADDGATRDQIEAMEELLLDQPEMQDHFLKLVAVHVLLDAEIRKTDATSPSLDGDDNAANGCPIPMPNEATAEEAAVQPAPRKVNRRALWQASALAASLFLMFWVGRVSNDGRTLDSEHHDLISIQDSRVRTDGLAILNNDSLELLGELTRDTGVTSVLLPHQSSSSQSQVTLCNGSAWYERPARKREQGYLVALKPGEHLSACIDTDAMGRNSLAVAEIDSSGYLTGKTMQFNNLPSGVSTVQQARAGAVGELSEINASAYTKYYLFAGSHMLYDDNEQEIWRQSDFEVQLDQDGLLVLGWDDSGYSGLIQAKEFEAPPDRDYNDIRAMLRISSPIKHGQGLVFSPPAITPEQLAPEESKGYTFQVDPHQQVIMAVYSDAMWQNSMRVIDTHTGRIIWSDDGPPEIHGVRQERNRGIYLITNSTDETEHYLIQGRHRPGGSGPDAAWVHNKFRVLAKDNKTAVVGFDDPQKSGPLDSWDDVRVFLRKFAE